MPTKAKTSQTSTKTARLAQRKVAQQGKLARIWNFHKTAVTGALFVFIVAIIGSVYLVVSHADVVNVYMSPGGINPTPNWSKYSLTYCKAHYDVLKSGSKNSCVATVQSALNAAYYFASKDPMSTNNSSECKAAAKILSNGTPLKPDADFGTKTDTVLRCYQKAHVKAVTGRTSLDVDGQAGGHTFDEMWQYCNWSYDHAVYQYAHVAC